MLLGKFVSIKVWELLRYRGCWVIRFKLNRKFMVEFKIKSVFWSLVKKLIYVYFK